MVKCIYNIHVIIYIYTHINCILIAITSSKTTLALVVSTSLVKMQPNIWNVTGKDVQGVNKGPSYKEIDLSNK